MKGLVGFDSSDAHARDKDGKWLPPTRGNGSSANANRAVAKD